jgi:hypothetical protein
LQLPPNFPLVLRADWRKTLSLLKESWHTQQSFSK